MPRTKMLKPSEMESSRWTEKTLLALATDVKSGRLPDRVRGTDDLVIGLKFIVSVSGRVTFHANYSVENARLDLMLGELTAPKNDPDHISLTDARELTKTIRALAINGIDVAEGARRRLLRELKKEGTSWRPK